MILREQVWEPTETVELAFAKLLVAHDKVVAQRDELLAACKYALHCEECVGLAANPKAIALYRAAIKHAEEQQ